MKNQIIAVCAALMCSIPSAAQNVPPQTLPSAQGNTAQAPVQEKKPVVNTVKKDALL